MALIPCAECGIRISEKATSCNSCGRVQPEPYPCVFCSSRIRLGNICNFCGNPQSVLCVECGSRLSGQATSCNSCGHPQPAARRPHWIYGQRSVAPVTGRSSYDNPFYTPDPAAAKPPAPRGGMGGPYDDHERRERYRQELLELASQGFANCFHCPIQVVPTNPASWWFGWAVKVRYVNPRPHRSGGSVLGEGECAECGKPVEFPIEPGTRSPATRTKRPSRSWRWGR